MEKTEDFTLTSVNLRKPSRRLSSPIKFIGQFLKDYYGIQIIYGKITVLQVEQN